VVLDCGGHFHVLGKNAWYALYRVLGAYGMDLPMPCWELNPDCLVIWAIA
jgi:hypothetical protein